MPSLRDAIFPAGQGKRKRELPEAEASSSDLTSGAVWRSRGGAVRKAGREAPPLSFQPFFSSETPCAANMPGGGCFFRLELYYGKR